MYLIPKLLRFFSHKITINPKQSENPISGKHVSLLKYNVALK